MTKSLSKLNHREISESLGDIYSLVADAKYVCRSCARSCQDRSQLCKPVSIPKKYGAIAANASPVQSTVAVATQSNATLPEMISIEEIQSLSKKDLKKAKKQAKKQAKVMKKMAKVVKKQSKLIAKQKKIEQQFLKFNTQDSHQQSALH